MYIQQGGVGVQVGDNSSRIRFTGVIAKSNLKEGWQFVGDGTAISLTGCAGYGNGTYSRTLLMSDVLVSGSAHVGLFGFACGSTLAGYALLLDASPNHVTNDDPTCPGGMSVSGVPGGW